MLQLEQELKSNAYPGRGIVIGRSANGKYAVTAYFIMGRSANSRNRVFVTEGEGIRTQAFDPSKLEDPSLIIYAPVRVLGNKTIVTNGDQTDTIYEGMDKQLTFEQSLRSREFEPDGPNSHVQTIFRSILPAAKYGIVTAIVLGVGRAIGEAMAITLVSGSSVNVPLPFNSVRFLTTAIVSEMGYSSGLHRQVLFTIGLVLFVFIMIINIVLNKILKKGADDNE